MNCKQCRERMPFIGRIESTRFFFCQHCDCITVKVDGCPRAEYLRQG